MRSRSIKAANANSETRSAFLSKRKISRSLFSSITMIEELANEYATYAKVDLSGQMKILHDTIEDMMMRLEEFESIIGMVQTEGAECMSGHLPQLQSAGTHLEMLCKRIDALEHVVARVSHDMTSLESAMETAEVDLGVPDRLFGILNPLSYFKKSQEPVIAARSPVFEVPVIYKTEDFFRTE